MRARPEALQALLLDPGNEVQAPLDLDAVYGRRAPLRVEIGFGGGEALGWQAARFPDRDFLGIELPLDCVQRAAASLHAEGVRNVRLLRGDARYLLDLLLPEGALERVLMQFPMPWPKKRHAKHRVSSPAFADSLARALAPGGRFELVTDQQWYADEAEEVFRAHPAFAAPERLADPPRAFRTRYERKWLEEGRTIHRLRAERLAGAPAPAPRLQTVAMEHLHLQAHPAAEAVHALPGPLPADGSTQAEIKRVWDGPDGWLLQVLASDDGFAQLFHLRIRRREDGSSLLQIAECPRPFWTPAVRHALRQVGAALGAPGVGR